MTNKGKYQEFCKTNYVPIYSRIWWMDAVCGEENWDVWLYKTGNDVLAAMPYYMEERGEYNYITKAPLTQNNGIIFKENKERKPCSQAGFEEKIIRSACEFIRDLDVDVYEQQYMYSFRNYLPFFWEKYTAITRYTYVIENTKKLDAVWDNLSSNYRNKIRKGKKNCHIAVDIEKDDFYKEHEKIFAKQNLSCPFSKDLWFRLYQECKAHDAGMTMCAKNEEEEVESLVFLVWDERSVYQILGGNMPEYQQKDTYAYLIWKGIEFAYERGLDYDFEGSMIKRISKSFREFGGEPKPYFRIRKIFNPEIIRKEAENGIEMLVHENSAGHKR